MAAVRSIKKIRRWLKRHYDPLNVTICCAVVMILLLVLA